MGKLVEDWMKSGKLLATEGCLPTALGARVRIENGKFSVSDGPFTESKEVVGGFRDSRCAFKGSGRRVREGVFEVDWGRVSAKCASSTTRIACRIGRATEPVRS